ncbi:Pentatricopeptide repeat-containing protein [Thalictrum thalictroides]|uniref:Pentatricopeptide repeat-containing protein n=1 Tax=Thalictrum thalictroides TaxID=46969 RepID=A0A7J6VF06_THATH|nr:Pentatricopeptide repeat-containing protein [Thalictrum thalictroides]
MPQRDVVSWTILIEGNKNVGKFDNAHLVFQRMLYSGVLPNRVTMVNVLSLCASSGMLSIGVWIHDYIRERGWELDVILGTSLIDMYAKCGKIEKGLRVFHSMNEKNVSTWNSLINGLALGKGGEEAMQCFSLMELEGIMPDEVTLLGVLSACSHSGMVQTGRKYFYSMVNGKYGFQPSIKHFGCMIGMLARAGCLDEAFKLIETMPFKPTKSMWGAMHTGCRLQGSLELCEFTAWKLIELEPEIAAYYASLSNLYAEMGRWSDVEKVRKLMKERKLVKDVGYSFVEVQEHKKQDYVSFAA